MIRVEVVADHLPLRQALATALSFEAGIDAVESREESFSAAESRESVRTPAHVLVLAEPLVRDLGRWAASVRKAAPGVKIVLLAITHRADELSGRGLADAVIDAAGGVLPLLAAVRSVVGLPSRVVAT